LQNKPEKDASVSASLSRIEGISLSPLDLLPHEDLREKLVELALSGVPSGIPPESAASLQQIKDALAREPVSELQVVVFGGGTGLSTIIGGDSRAVSWTKDPFSGLKNIFPKTRSIVCITDDGGSTGEMLKDLPLIALGDIRHVLLSSIQLSKLQDLYSLSVGQSVACVELLANIFNYRFAAKPANSEQLFGDCGLREQTVLPNPIALLLERTVQNLFDDSRLRVSLERPQCLGNLILASSVYEHIPSHYSAEDLLDEQELLRQNLNRGIASLCVMLGANEKAVIPCSTVPAELSVRYTNGVQATGEHKSGAAQRNYPVEHVCVNYCEEPVLASDIKALIESADIMIMAPGSLYTSLIPIFQIPGIAETVKKNQKALKILVSNLWVQAGETDLSLSEPDRKFHLSDLLKAYEQNIPGGTKGLFNKVLCLSFKDVPATVIQSYAVEGKIPIYLDRDKVRRHGIVPLECSIYSTSALRDLGVIRHDPQQFATVVQTLWAGFCHLPVMSMAHVYTELEKPKYEKHLTGMMIPCLRYKKIGQYLADISIQLTSEKGSQPLNVRKVLQRILWDHKDIPLSHLQFVKGIQCIPTEDWKRNQNWDRVYSFYDPYDGFVKIRQDQFDSETYLEVAFLVALGQSLLGNYARDKEIRNIENDGLFLGKAYHLQIRKSKERKCYFSEENLAVFLALSRMVQDENDPEHFTRIVNGREGFTPPGLLFGLTYAWYLDNRFASHIEYKMAVIRIDRSDLIPEQVRMRSRREKLTDFFREVVFGH
jgi:uncharacterized cofD-like protein